MWVWRKRNVELFDTDNSSVQRQVFLWVLANRQKFGNINILWKQGQIRIRKWNRNKLERKSMPSDVIWAQIYCTILESKDWILCKGNMINPDPRMLLQLCQIIFRKWRISKEKVIWVFFRKVFLIILESAFLGSCQGQRLN